MKADCLQPASFAKFYASETEIAFSVLRPEKMLLLFGNWARQHRKISWQATRLLELHPQRLEFFQCADWEGVRLAGHNESSFHLFCPRKFRQVCALHERGRSFPSAPM
ncbi:protein of unknown function (plasmid) [Cupriavidus taiwanensis]|uniref:Uncharacterized protein n=1 Tax=Cupriavidus taiwanensis TaxID=164546 RepID=A0A375IPQ1_9BURK|nr:protein of unknown function [Cupriavidus taiwanensis]